MQVTVHSIDRTRVVDFTPEESRSTESPPFVSIEIHDGRGSQIDFLLRDKDDVYRLYMVARDAMALLAKVAPVLSS